MSDPLAELADAVAVAVTTMPDGHLLTLANRVAPIDSVANAWGITREPPVREYVEAATRILRAWERLPPDTTGATIAAALRSALTTRQHIAADQSIELVWTGPDTSHIRALPTSGVVIDVINAAERDLLLVSFASYRVDRIMTALRAAQNRDVNISLLLENATAAEGQYQGPVRDPFEGLRATRYQWATAARPRAGDRPAVMHAKIVLADDREAFVSSANLTGRALDANMEAGLLIKGGSIPRTLHAHFRELAYDGTLEVVDPTVD